MQLKQFAEHRTFDRELLRLWEDQLALHADDIHAKRHQFLEDFLPIFQHYYEIVSGGMEQVNVVYQSRLDEKPLNELLEESLMQDRYSGYTNVGIHKDDLEFELDGHPLKRFGSQGQQKSFVVSIRLAQFEFNYQKIGYKPILLLDGSSSAWLAMTILVRCLLLILNNKGLRSCLRTPTSTTRFLRSRRAGLRR